MSRSPSGGAHVTPAAGPPRHLVNTGLAVLGGLTFCLCALLAPPSVYWLDSGELTAAGAGLGIAHPTGFPFYAVLARLAGLVPVGEIGFRVALLSAAMAGVTVILVGRTVMLVDRGWAGVIGGLSGGAALAVSMVFLRHATIAEVYVPTAAFLALTLYLLVRVGAGAGAAHGLCLAVVVGIGLGLHGSYRLLVFWPFAALLIIRLRHGARWPLLAPMLTLGVAAGLHAYLPIRAMAAGPGLDWGHPDTIGAFMDHVRASSVFRSFDTQILASEPERWTVSGAELVSTLVDSLGPVAVILALVGLAWIPGRRRAGLWLGVCAILWIAIDLAYGIWINPMGLADLQNGVPLLVVAAVCVGAGVAALCRFSGAAGPTLAVAAGTLAILPAAVVGVPRVADSARGDAPTRWAEAALDQAESGAVLLVVGDSTAAPLLYMTAIAGARPDAVVLVRQFLPDRERTADLWHAARGAKAEVPGNLSALLRAGPALWQPGADAPPGVLLIPAAPLFRVAQPGDRASLEDVDRALSVMRSAFAGGDGGDRISRRVLALAMTQLAVQISGAGGAVTTKAEEILAAAVHVDPSLAQAWNNRGALASRRGDLEEAVRTTEQAIALAPNDVRARVNVSRYYLALGKPRRADRHARRAVALEPGGASALALAAQSAAALGDATRARELAARARRADPDNRDVRSLGAL